MADPRRPRTTLDHNRLMQRVEEGQERLRQSVEDGQAALTDRLEAAFDRIDKRFDSVEGSVRSGDFRTAELASEIQDIRRQVQDTRDTAINSANSQTREAAKGAAEGMATAMIPAVTAANRVDPHLVIKAVMNTFPAKMLAVAAAMATLGSGIENLPKIVKWVGAVAVGLWHFMSKDVK